jgi:hypothetical protein
MLSADMAFTVAVLRTCARQFSLGRFTNGLCAAQHTFPVVMIPRDHYYGMSLS